MMARHEPDEISFYAAEPLAAQDETIRIFAAHPSGTATARMVIAVITYLVSPAQKAGAEKNEFHLLKKLSGKAFRSPHK